MEGKGKEKVVKQDKKKEEKVKKPKQVKKGNREYTYTREVKEVTVTFE